MMKIGSIIFCVLLALASGAPLDGNGECPDGSPNGAQIVRLGRFILECQNGQIVPKGCYTYDLKKINIGETFDTRNFRVRCVSNGNELSLDAFACLLNGQEHKVDETFEQAENFYTCKREGKELRLVNLGCMADGKRVNLNDNVLQGDLVMLCNGTANNGARLMPSGCVKDGQQYQVGQTFESDKQWFTCTRVGREKVVAKPSGCVANGKRLNDGDRYQDNEVFRECMVESDKIETRVTACAQNENGNFIARVIGCTFTEGQYEMMCKKDGESAKKVFVRCNYSMAGGAAHSLEPGCYRTFDKQTMGCLAQGQSLQLQAYQSEDAASSAGLHQC